MKQEQKTCAGCFRILSDETRIRIMKVLQEGGGRNVNAITRKIGRSQPTVSHHLKTLLDASLVARERRGKEMIYTFNSQYACRGCGVFTAAIKI